LSVNSGSVDPAESKLLETMSIVNDDEDVVMADNLLDLELDTMILSQSTYSTSVSQVPHKGVHDSQARDSQFLQELYCKDQNRSNNYSAIVETTRSSTHPGIPLLEMAWDLEPAPTPSPTPPPPVTSRMLPHALQAKSC